MPIEKLNAYITNSVKRRVSPEAIERAVAECSVLTHNLHVMKETTSSYERLMKDIDKDVEKLKGELRALMGSTWRAARAHKARAPWTTSQNERGAPPWDEVERTMTRAGNDSVANVVARHARHLTRSYYTFMP